MKILLIGTSGHGITLSRNLPSALIDEQILVDCGEGLLFSLLNHKIPLTNIHSIFLTHLHGDHFLGLISFLWQLAYYDNIHRSPKIYVPEGMKKHLEAIFSNTFSYFAPDLFIPDVIELTLNTEQSFKISIKNHDYLIKWTKTIHNPLCYAYRFNDDVVFSGDSAYCEEIAKLALNSKLLLHEASFPDNMEIQAAKVNHSTPSQAAKIAIKSHTDGLYLYHVPNLTPIQERTFLQNAKLIFPRIQIAHDNELIDL